MIFWAADPLYLLEARADSGGRRGCRVPQTMTRR